MATSEADRWFGDYPWQDASSTSWTVHAVLEDTEAALRKSAGRLRSSGQEDGARQVERFAAWARFDLEEPLVARQLYLAVARLRPIRQPGLLAGQVLEKVMSLARADRGNVQLVDPQSGALTIIAQYGFDEKFLDHFAVVADRGSACGRAAWRNAQLVITDVVADRGFEPHREIAASSGFRAVQSTPLADREGRLIGVVSTHYARPYALSARAMRIIKRYADLAGQVLAASSSAAPPDGTSTGSSARPAAPAVTGAQRSSSTGSPTATWPGSTAEP